MYLRRPGVNSSEFQVLTKVAENQSLSTRIGRQFEMDLSAEDETGTTGVEYLSRNNGVARVGSLEVRKIDPDKKYPRDFTRIPIFSSISIKKQFEALGSIGGKRTVKSSWGEYRIYGVATLKDEDVLVALVRLRELRINGTKEELKAYGFPTSQDDDEKYNRVDYFNCRFSQIEKELGYKHGGRTRLDLQDSIERLHSLEIWVETEKGTEPLNILRANTRKEPNGEIRLRVAFTPWFLSNLHTNYVFLNPKIRAKLRPIGKKIYGFLVGQRNVYHIQIHKLMEAIGYDGNIRAFKKPLRETLDILMLDEHGLRWIRHYSIYKPNKSSGREQTHLLVVRSDATAKEMHWARREDRQQLLELPQNG